MKTIFVYYSFSGNGDLVADLFRESGAEVRKAVPKKSLPKSFFGAMMKGGFLATLGHKPPLVWFDSDLSGFDRVVIGSPVWNGRLSCPINTVLDTLDLTGKKVDFVLYAGGGAAPKAEMRIKKQFPDASILVLKEPKKYPDELTKVKVFFE